MNKIRWGENRGPPSPLELDVPQEALYPIVLTYLSLNRAVTFLSGHIFGHVPAYAKNET